MAIEFCCPHCAVSIRVPDSAAGKQGRCPGCETQLLVPNPRPLPNESAASTPPEFSSEATSSLRSPAPPPSDEEIFLPIDDAPGQVTANFEPLPPPIHRPVTRSLRRRRRTFWAIWIPILCGAGLFAFLAWYLIDVEPELEGELTAEIVGADEVPPRQLFVSRWKIDADQAQSVLDELHERPLRLLSTENTMQLELRGDREGEALQITVDATTETQFVRVNPRNDGTLRLWIRDHLEELESRRHDELALAVEEFFASQSHAIETGSADHNLLAYRNRLGLNALVAGFGYCVEAQTTSGRHRCVFEDAQGRLYFLLPPDATKFRLIGRELEDGSVLFPGSYQVTIKPQSSERETAESIDTSD